MPPFSSAGNFNHWNQGSEMGVTIKHANTWPKLQEQDTSVLHPPALRIQMKINPHLLASHSHVFKIYSILWLLDASQ